MKFVILMYIIHSDTSMATNCIRIISLDNSVGCWAYDLITMQGPELKNNEWSQLQTKHFHIHSQIVLIDSVYEYISILFLALAAFSDTALCIFDTSLQEGLSCSHMQTVQLKISLHIHAISVWSESIHAISVWSESIHTVSVWSESFMLSVSDLRTSCSQCLIWELHLVSVWSECLM